MATELERLAKAAYEAMTARMRFSGVSHSWEAQSPALHADWIEAQRAALTALREPSEEALWAGASGAICDDAEEVGKILRAMIDHILEGK